MATTFEFTNRPFSSEDHLSDLDLLLERLGKYALGPCAITANHPAYPGQLHFWGNFEEFSGAFSVVTDDDEVIAKLLNAFKANAGYRRTLNKG